MGQDCVPGTATGDLDINNVRARLHNNGAQFYPSSFYEVPKGSGKFAVFASEFWIGGLVNDELRVAAGTYAQGSSDFEFFPGPLNDDGTPPQPGGCAAYDDVWVVSRADIDDYEQNGTLTDDLRRWPFLLGAPVIDGDGDPDNYNLSAGDRPELEGDQMAWWIMNDAAGPHLTFMTDPLGLEVRVSAYAYAENEGPLAHTTFYRYQITYKGTAPLEDAYLGFWVDADLGQFTDDFIGSDSTLHLAYVYNGDNDDEGGGGYGPRPPALGYTLLQGPVADPNGRDDDYDGMVDEEGEHLGMSYAMQVLKTGFQGIRTSSDVYMRLQGKWNDGSPLTLGGDGFEDDLGLGPTNYVFSGQPPFFWSEENTGIDERTRGGRNVPADRRFMLSSGPFSMQPGETEEVTLAIVWSQSFDRLSSVLQLKRDVAEIRGLDPGERPPSPDVPLLVSPTDGADPVQGTPFFVWEAAPVDPANPTFYYLQVAQDPLFSDQLMEELVLEGTATVSGLESHTTYYWRVLVANLGGEAVSEIRTFTVGEVLDGDIIGLSGGGLGIVEVANEDGPLPEPIWDAGGFGYRGNTVWHSLNAAGYTKRYYVSSGTGLLEGLETHIQYAATRDFEMRFTDAGGYCVYGFENNAIARVPFELWDVGIGTFDDASDDQRMIPFCQSRDGTTPDAWRMDSGTEEPFFLDYPASDEVYWFDPHPNEGGYAAFAAAAESAGGIGAIYPEDDGSIDGYFANLYGAMRYPIGRFLLADFDGSGEPPPSGTIIRIHTNKPESDTYAYEAGLLGEHVAVPAVTLATGSLTASLQAGQLAIEGSVDGLVGEITDVVVGQGAVTEAGTVLAILDTELAADGRGGSFFTNQFVPTQALIQGELFVQVNTTAFPNGEVRGSLMPSPNGAPTTAAITVPVSGAMLDLMGDRATPFSVRWQPAGDPNGNRVGYVWQLATDAAFSSLIAQVPAPDAALTTTFGTLDQWLQAAGVAVGNDVTLYHRVVSTDGSLATTGAASVLEVHRGVVPTSADDAEVPTRFALHGNYPNPFNPTTTLSFDLPFTAEVAVEVFDVLGRRVLVLPGETIAAGAHRTRRVDASALASGVYLYRLTASGPETTWTAAGRFLLIK